MKGMKEFRRRHRNLLTDVVYTETKDKQGHTITTRHRVKAPNYEPFRKWLRSSAVAKPHLSNNADLLSPKVRKITGK